MLDITLYIVYSNVIHCSKPEEYIDRSEARGCLRSMVLVKLAFGVKASNDLYVCVLGTPPEGLQDPGKKGDLVRPCGKAAEKMVSRPSPSSNKCA